jgi:hypothetical protein
MDFVCQDLYLVLIPQQETKNSANTAFVRHVSQTCTK